MSETTASAATSSAATSSALPASAALASAPAASAAPASAPPASAAAAFATPAGVVIGESATPRGRRARIALRGLQVLLALFYALASALPKLIGHESAAQSFDELGWGSAGMYTIGVLELAGAVALLIPVLQSVAAIALSLLMVGAFVVQIAVFDGEYAATPLILIVPLALIAWARRGHNADLVRLLRRGA
ncbi:DoxX family protein [Streptomyces sp. NPDC085931]|uniref:DoxX family protein n=1 Tax=Streptomyces sp. NPDC085931 TaxID=3365740 RepID=UPI0037D1E59E